MSYFCSACGYKSSVPAKVCLCCGAVRVFMIPFVRGTVTVDSLLRYCRRKYVRSLRKAERKGLRAGLRNLKEFP